MPTFSFPHIAPLSSKMDELTLSFVVSPKL
jgi:hypothetical protein